MGIRIFQRVNYNAPIRIRNPTKFQGYNILNFGILSIPRLSRLFQKPPLKSITLVRFFKIFSRFLDRYLYLFR